MKQRKRRFLCICQGGNVRSVALAFLLKYMGEQDAIAASAEKNTEDTLTMLWDWADYVIVLAENVLPFLPKAVTTGRKFVMVDVGPDRWGTALHPELLGLLKPVVVRWQQQGWQL